MDDEFLDDDFLEDFPGDGFLEDFWGGDDRPPDAETRFRRGVFTGFGVFDIALFSRIHAP